MTLLDLALLAVALGSVWTAGRRGLGRELLHLVLYGCAVSGGLWFMGNFPAPNSPTATVKVLIDFGYYVVVAYLFTWIIGKFGAAALFDDEYPTMLSRLLAGVLALAGLAGTMLGLNLWLAMHSPDAHPLRLLVLPNELQESVIIQKSDEETDEIYQWLASKGWLDYRKYTYRKDEETDPERARVYSQVLGNSDQH